LRLCKAFSNFHHSKISFTIYTATTSSANLSKIFVHQAPGRVVSLLQKSVRVEVRFWLQPRHPMAPLPTTPDTKLDLNLLIKGEDQRSPDAQPLFFTSNTSHGPVPTPLQKQWSEADVISPQSTTKPMRPFGATLQSHSDVSKTGDGIRKANARFDIPAERNLNNIDQLIASSTDEQEVRELKLQKRLLTNRQAA
jgi:hypothetical protein